MGNAADRVGQELTNQPEVQVELLNVIGSAYQAIDLDNHADPLYREALRIGRKDLGNENLLVAQSLYGLAMSLGRTGHLGEVPLLREALAIQRKLLGEDNEAVAKTLSQLGVKIRGASKAQQAEGEAMEREALAIRRKLFGETNLNVAYSLDNLGLRLDNDHKPAEAESVYRQSLAIKESIYGPTHPELVLDLRNIGSLLLEQADKEEVNNAQGSASAKIAQAIQYKREALKMNWQFHTVNDASSVELLNDLLMQLRWQGRIAESDQWFEDAFSFAKERREPDMGGVLKVRASIRFRDGRFTEAADDLAKVLEAMPSASDRWYPLAALLAYSGDVAGYRTLCERMLARWATATNALDLERTANACLLLPPAEAQLQAITQVADRAASLGQGDGQSDWFRFAQGLADYRQGHFARVLELADAALAETNRPMLGTARVEVWTVAAMAQQRLGHTTEAREGLVKAVERSHADLVPPGTIWFTSDYSELWLAPQVLLREAKELILKRPVDHECEDLAHALRKFAVANLIRGNLPAAEFFLRSARSLYGQGPECEGPGLAETLRCLRVVLGREGKKAEADRLAAETAAALDWSRKTVGYSVDAGSQNDHAWLLATSRDAELRDGANAVVFAEAAVATTKRKNAEYLDTLAAAYAEAGQLEKAITIQKEAIVLTTSANSSGNTSAYLKSELEAHLKLYQSGTPCRE